MKLNKKIIIILSQILLPFFVVAQQPQATPPPFTVRYPNTLPKPALLRGPYLQVATSNSIIIRWRTESLSRSKVIFGTEEGKLNLFVDDAVVNAIQGLVPNSSIG